MPKNNSSINNSLFDLLKGKGYSPTMLSTAGKEIPTPDEAEVFQFNFVKDGEDYGKVTLSIDDSSNLIVYYSDDVADSEKGNGSTYDWDNFIDKIKDFKKSKKTSKLKEDDEEAEGGDLSWYGLLNQLKRFAQRYQLSFELRNTDNLKSDMAKRDYMKKQDQIAESRRRVSEMDDRTTNGVSKDDPDYHHHLGNTIKHLRQFGNIDLINKQGVAEEWSQKYKSSINCSHPKGFSQKAHCAGKKKHNESIEMEMVCEDCGMCETHVDHENLDEACWKGYHKEGNKKMFGKTYPNCVKNKKTNEEQEVGEDARIARKPGQPAGSKKHSDLYTDENPIGTITGLKFATAEDAIASVSKIRNSGRSHAHKIQAAVAMEQRAKAAGKAEAASVYRKYINATKKTEGVAEGSLNESDKFTSWYDWKDQAKSSGYTITKKDDKIVALNKQGQVVGHWSDVGKFLSGKAPRPNFKRPVEQGVAEGYSLKKTSVSKHMEPGDPEEYTQDVNIKDTDYEIINNKTGQVVGTASQTTNDFMGSGALKITMKNGATRWLDIWDSEKGNPQTAFNRFVKDPKTASKYKGQDMKGVTEMDKTQTPSGRDGHISYSTYGSIDKGGSTGAERTAKLVTAKQATTDAMAILNKQLKKKDVAEGTQQVSEGYYPMGKQGSYSDAVPTTKIVIQHSRSIEEGEQRYRNIAKIFVENSDGERFAVPTNKPGLARVYARHIAEGGTPYDERGRHITSLVEEYSKMSGFMRATRGKQFNESAQKLVTEAVNYYQSLRESLSKMTGHRGYSAYFESWTPALMEDGEEQETNLNELFVQETLDPRIESVMPILGKLQRKLGNIKQVDELAEWADNIIEGDGGQEALNSQGIPEAAGAETLAHNIRTDRSNLKAFDLEETTDVTDDNPTSQGGTRAELLQKYANTKSPKDAEAARRAGASQSELKAAADSTEEIHEGASSQDLQNAILYRVEMRHPDLVSKYGHEYVADKALDVASFYAGAEEIGSSDISAMVRHLVDTLKREGENGLDENLDANQIRAGQLGPTEKVGPQGAVGKLVGAEESVNESEDELARILQMVKHKR